MNLQESRRKTLLKFFSDELSCPASRAPIDKAYALGYMDGAENMRAATPDERSELVLDMLQECAKLIEAEIARLKK